MQLLVIRHARAMAREAFAKTCPDDGLRPLTKEGRKRMAIAANGLRTLIEQIDLLATSPLTRAVETAQILADAYSVRPMERAELAPSRPPAALAKWLQRQPEKAIVAIVGHEPHLSLCISWFLSGLDDPFVEMKKGAACLLEFPKKVAPGHGRLRWLLTSRQLGRLRP